jgi:general secretion pathway protein I
MRRSERGFTLLEVMVALVIAGIALGVLYHGALGGMLQTRVALQYQEAIARANSRLATIGHGAPIEPGDRSGDDGGGYRWHTRISVISTAPGDPDHKFPVAALYAVQVAIAWGEGDPQRSLELDTKRTGFIAPAAP